MSDYGLLAKDNYDNSYHFFDAGGQEFMVIALEVAPTDKMLDWGPDPDGDPGWYGINIHDTLAEDGITELNKGSSAACQVFASRHEHAAMMDLAHHAARLYGPRFTYTLILLQNLLDVIRELVAPVAGLFDTSDVTPAAPTGAGSFGRG